jgi:predicted nucleic-acid-binding Zn-ribbon protein
MEVVDLLKKASQGELQCPKCGAAGVSLKDVRIGVARVGANVGKPEIMPSAYGQCGKCGAKIPIEKLQEMSDRPAEGKKWWQFWK